MFAPGKNKEFFYLFDYCQNLEFFSQNPEHVDGSVSESLSTKLFKTRLQFIAALGERKDGADKDEAQVSMETINQLHAQVTAMNLDNFVVRPKRKSVEKYAKREAWQSLGADDFNELSENLSRLPTELIDTNEEAMNCH